MAGKVVSVTQPREFNFSDLAASKSQTVTPQEQINCSQYDYVDMIVRVHDDATIGGGAKIEVVAVTDGHTEYDPNQTFFGDPIATASLTSSPTAGTLKIVSASSLLGRALAVQVVATQDAQQQSMSARISVELVLKSR